MFIEIRCQFCRKVLLEVSRDFLGLVRSKCRHCKKLNVVSLAVIVKQPPREVCYTQPKSAPV